MQRTRHVEAGKKDGSDNFLFLFEIGENRCIVEVASEEGKRNIKAQFIKYISY